MVSIFWIIPPQPRLLRLLSKAPPIIANPLILDDHAPLLNEECRCLWPNYAPQSSPSNAIEQYDDIDGDSMVHAGARQIT
jgi:hypothetical protein